MKVSVIRSPSPYTGIGQTHLVLQLFGESNRQLTTHCLRITNMHSVDFEEDDLQAQLNVLLPETTVCLVEGETTYTTDTLCLAHEDALSVLDTIRETLE